MISVIVPVYNTEKYLEQCIESILKQTYKEIELYLVDDGSTDSSGKICDKYARIDHRVNVIHQKNNGASNARNSALKIIAGEWVCFVDSDDWLEPIMFETLLDLAERTDSPIVECDVYDEFPNSSKARNIWGIVGDQAFSLEGNDCWLKGFAYTPVLWNKLIQSNLIRDIKFSETISYGEDSLFLSRVIERVEKVSVISKPLYHYRSAREGNVVSAKINERTLDLIYSYDKICANLRGKGTDAAIGHLVYTAALQLIFKIPIKGNKTKYLSTLKTFTAKYMKEIDSLRISFRVSRFRLILVKISSKFPMISVIIWNLSRIFKNV